MVLTTATMMAIEPVVLYWSDSAIFPYTAAIFFLLAAAAEVSLKSLSEANDR